MRNPSRKNGGVPTGSPGRGECGQTGCGCWLWQAGRAGEGGSSLRDSPPWPSATAGCIGCDVATAGCPPQRAKQPAQDRPHWAAAPNLVAPPPQTLPPPSTRGLDPAPAPAWQPGEGCSRPPTCVLAAAAASICPPQWRCPQRRRQGQRQWRGRRRSLPCAPRRWRGLGSSGREGGSRGASVATSCMTSPVTTTWLWPLVAEARSPAWPFW